MITTKEATVITDSPDRKSQKAKKIEEPVARPSHEVASFSGQSTHDSEDETVSIAGTSTSTSSKSHSIQMSIKQNFQNVTSFSEGGDKFNRITNSILFLICKDMQPFNIVNNDGFQHLMKTVVPLYKLPSRDTFSRRLDNKYKSQREIILY